MRVGLTGLTMAEYFRDKEHKDVLLFIDNIFRFIQAGSEVSALLGRIPSAVGYQPTLGTDVGAGTSFSLLNTLNEAYKVMQLQGYKLSAFEAFYLATRGGAEALGIADKVGSDTLLAQIVVASAPKP